MIKAPWIWIVFAAAVVAQLAAPGSMIYRSEKTLREGQAFKFKTAPVDPYDAFRGRYVALSFENAEAPEGPPGRQIGYDVEVYALLENGPDGFARFRAATLEPPDSGAYLKVRTTYSWKPNIVALRLPFDRFYMPEELAPKAETAYREHSRRGQQDAYAVVRVRDGVGVIENVYVAGQPISEFVRGK